MKYTLLKKLFLVAVISIFTFSGNLFAQDNVGIGTNAPDASALLELLSTNKGVLVPRMTTVQRLAIVTPANGLLVYDTNFDCFFYFNFFSSYCIVSKNRNFIIANFQKSASYC